MNEAIFAAVFDSRCDLILCSRQSTCCNVQTWMSVRSTTGDVTAKDRAPTRWAAKCAATVHRDTRTTAIRAAKVGAGCLSFHATFLDSETTQFSCSDVNECLNNNGGCHSKRTCTNTPGGRTCGDCLSGYENDGDTGCKGQC